ncbi:MAG: hypothetical protein SGI83_07310 [Bacteroidota bacterium]|nr:hypothetical protein [Bacteroidota bacterium]
MIQFILLMMPAAFAVAPFRQASSKVQKVTIADFITGDKNQESRARVSTD